MKSISTKRKIKIYPIIWTGIIMVSIYLIYRFATLSFLGNIGQAESTVKSTFISNLCSSVIEKGSGLVSFTAQDQQNDSKPFGLLTKHLSIHKFSITDNTLTADAKDNLSTSGNNKKDTEGDAAAEAMSNHVVSGNMGFYKISGQITREYILTNGLIYNSALSSESNNNTEQLIGYTPGNVDFAETEDDNDNNDDSAVETITSSSSAKYTLAQLKDFNFLVNNFYVVDSSTRVTKDLFNGEKLLGKDLKMKQKNDKPQILIYHTHAHETYADSRSGNQDDTVVGVGTELTDILQNTYGYNVIHDKTGYDIVNGELDRSYAYHQAKVGVTNILKQYPSIEVVIDLHRDSGAARNVTINGKKTAQVMLFNGLSRDKDGPITYLANPGLQTNIAFSLQMQLKARELYPSLFVRNYLKNYRYNMHLRPKTLLVELGTVNNTVQSAKNAMDPLAKILDTILQGK